MTREKATEYLKGMLGQEPTKEQIDDLLKNVNKEDQEQQKQIEDLTKQVETLTNEKAKYGDYDDIKKQLDDINKAKMTEQEKIDELKKKTEENYKKSQLTVNKALVREKLSNLNLDSKKLDELVDSMATDDEKTTLNRTDLYIETITSIKESTIKETKDDLLKVDVQPNIKDSVTEVTKKMGDLSYNEKLELKRNKPQEYELLKKQD